MAATARQYLSVTGNGANFSNSLQAFGKISRRTGRLIVAHEAPTFGGIGGEIAARILEATGVIDVSERMKLVKAPTLVLHPRGDMMVPFDQGRIIAAGIPDAKFVELETNNHVLTESEPAWQRWQEVVGEFLGWRRETPRRRAADAPVASNDLAMLTAREREILDLVAGGDSNHDIAKKLFISEKTVRNHLTGIFDKLGVSSRSQAIVFARDRGMAGRPN